MTEVWNKFPDTKVLIVPRHPERFSEVAHNLISKNIPFLRYSDLSTKKGGEKVVLVDAMGVLRKCYQLATLAIVGGSYISRSEAQYH